MSGNWEKRRVETFESLGSIARPSFVVENGQPGPQQLGGEPIPVPPSTARSHLPSSWTPRGSRPKIGPTASPEALL